MSSYAERSYAALADAAGEGWRVAPATCMECLCLAALIQAGADSGGARGFGHWLAKCPVWWHRKQGAAGLGCLAAERSIGPPWSTGGGGREEETGRGPGTKEKGAAISAG